MPFIPHTPESLLPRSDSKNPASTCRGLTSGGRPCRRSISTSPQSTRSNIIIGSRPSIENNLSPEKYCWQHKDQSPVTSAQASPQRILCETIQERTSVDTLVDRLGLLEINNAGDRRKRRKEYTEQTHKAGAADHSRVRRDKRVKHKSTSNLSLSCCIGDVDDEYIPPRRRLQEKPMREYHSSSLYPPKTTPSRSPVRPIIKRDPSSKTEQLLALIPRNATPQITSLLLTELTKPISEFDEEGYIYMFWLTPESLPSTPPSEVAPSLLEVSTDRQRPQPGQRRTSDVLQTFASASQDSSQKILLKIGRASNVQRRLNEWTRQCGYNLSLIRYYPYHSTSTPNLSSLPTKVPHAHKVERLIHIELSGKKAQQDSKCRSCGREHREWFEVEASRNGVKAVDDIIRRWVEWGLQNHS